jgi:lysophospholipase L1-like esterase
MKFYIENFASNQSFYKYASAPDKQEKANFLNVNHHRYLGYTPKPNFKSKKNQHNQFGFRGEKIKQLKDESTYRIICIGGSTTYGTAVEDYKNTYPYLLEKQLNDSGKKKIEVINAGVKGYSSFESLLNFQLNLLEFNPDLIIINHGINDLSTRLVWPPEAYRGDNSGYRVDPYPQHLAYDANWINYFYLGRLVKQKLMSDYEFQKEHLQSIGRAKTDISFEIRYQNLKETYPSGFFLEHPIEEILLANPPKFLKRNLSLMGEIAKENGIATLYTSFLYHKEAKSSMALPALAVEISKQNELIETLATEKGFYFFDLARSNNEFEAYFTDDVHLNEKGNQLKAMLFANFLNDSILTIPLKTSSK